MSVPSTVADLSATAALNSPAGSESIGTNLDDYLRSHAAILRQVYDAAPLNVGTVSGTDTITATPSPALTAYAQRLYTFVSVGANTTTSVTLNLNGLGAKAVTKNGTTALAIGDIPSGAVCEVFYDGAQFQLVAIPKALPVFGTAATLNVGTSANNIVKLNGSAQLPAVDGSMLTGIASGAPQASTAEILAESAVAKYISPDRLSSSKRTAKIWVNFTSVTTTSAASSQGISGFTDNGVGDTTINFSPSTTDTNYAVVGMSSCAQGAETTFSVKAAAMGGVPVTKTTSAVRVITTGAGGYRDEASQSIAIFGN